MRSVAGCGSAQAGVSAQSAASPSKTARRPSAEPREPRLRDGAGPGERDAGGKAPANEGSRRVDARGHGVAASEARCGGARQQIARAAQRGRDPFGAEACHAVGGQQHVGGVAIEMSALASAPRRHRCAQLARRFFHRIDVRDRTAEQERRFSEIWRHERTVRKEHLAQRANRLVVGEALAAGRGDDRIAHGRTPPNERSPSATAETLRASSSAPT